MANFTFGSDPEFMVADKSGNFVSAIGKVPGTKKDMLPLGNGHYAFHDNVLAECTPHYGRDKEEVVRNFRDCFSRYANVVAPYRLVPRASNTYPLAECEHPAALEFGCDPEMNAYDMREVMPPTCEAGNTFRSGGGHIHLGHVDGDVYPLVHVMGRWWLTRLLDLFVGLPSILIDNDPTSQARRQLYGGAGNMRPKPYGLEYRTLSNFWLATPRLVRLNHDLCGFVLDFMQKDDFHQNLWETYADELRDTINAGNRTQAAGLWEIVSVHVPAAIRAEVEACRTLPPQDFYSSWGIETHAAAVAAAA